MDLKAPITAPLLAINRPQGPQALALKPGAMALHSADGKPDLAQITKAARDLESAFAKMLISSMRQASFGDPLFSQQNTAYRDMYDQQLAKNLSAGQGLGLTPVIVRQLSGQQGSVASDPDKPLPMLPINRPNTPSPATREATPALGSYHHPANATSPAWLSGRAELLEKDMSLSLAAGTGPDESGNDLSLLQDSFALMPPIPSAPAPANQTARTIKSGTPDDFVASIWPQAQRAAQALGVDPRMLVAQAALETGWGRHVVGRQSDGSGGNLFGIKAGGRWSGQSVDASTQEYINGAAVQQTASFRAYGSVEESFNDYVALLKNNGRYAGAIGTGGDHRRFATALSQAGYATDPHYASKLVAIAEGPTLRRALDQLNPGQVLAANETSARNAPTLPTVAES